MTKATTQRPHFNRVKFESEVTKYYQAQEDEDEGYLNKLGINDIIIACAGKINDVYNENVGENFTYEIALISHCFNFLQHHDLSDPSTIRKFALFFRNTVKKYAIRFHDEDGKQFINASLGEIDEELYSENCDCHKLILIVTAFYTKSCLTSGKNPDNPINHIDEDNHSIEYQTDKITRNAMQCIINMEMTDKSAKEVMKKYIVHTDIHTRGGTIGKGNVFADFVDELNKDPELSDFCRKFKDQLGLEESIEFDKTKLTSCLPILIDLILGICNISLYAAYTTARRKKIHLYLASSRSWIVFRPNGVGLLQGVKVADVALGFHPNFVEKNLTNKTPQDMILLDDGITAVLKPLNGVPIKVIINGEESEAEFSGDKSDFFQRLYSLREWGGEKDDYGLDDYKLLKKAQKKLVEMKERWDEEKRKLKEIQEKLNQTKQKWKKYKKLKTAVRAKLEYDVNLELSRERQDKRKEESDKTRAKLNSEGSGGLEALLVNYNK